MLRVLLAGIRLLVDWHQPHQSHQAARTMPPAFIPLPLHISRHLSRPVPRGFQKLFVDDLHELQVLSTLANRRVVQVRAGQRQQVALPADAQFRVLFLNAHLPVILA